MKSIIKSVTLTMLCMFAAVVNAVEFDGFKFPDTVTLEGTNTELQLNGIGYRTKFVFDVYVGALYTVSKVNSRDAVQALSGPNRILMHFVYSEVEKEKLVDGWNDGFENNNINDRVSALKDRIDQFNAMFTTVVEGDVVLLDYIPGKGTKVIIKGEEKGIIPGEDFNAALLDIWLGEEPADEGLKDAMLGL